MRLTAIRRFGLLLTVVGAVLLACAGVVLAQSGRPESTSSESSEADSGQTTKLREADRVAAEEQAAQEDARATSDDISALSAGDPVPGRYIVMLKDDAARGAAEASSSTQEEPAQIASAMSEDFQLEVKRTYRNALEGFAARIPEDQVEEVRSDPRVEFVAQDAVANLHAQPIPTGITRTDTVSSTTANINGADERVDADVAVLDSGISPHSDLNRPAGADCSTDGYSNYYSDGLGHGTHVAGTVGAIDNDSGVVGVAPGARVWAIKVLDNGGFDNGWGTVGDTLCGIDVVTANADLFEVVNMSLGWDAKDGNGNWYSADDGNCGARNTQVADAMHKAICNSVNAGVTYVVSAGNESRDAHWGFPAAFNEVITVSALADYNGFPGGGAPNTCGQDSASDDWFTSFTNYGADVDIAAPGACIRSTYKPVREAYRKRIKVRGRWRWVTRYRWVGGYETMQGTSMASPHVAGAAALIKSWAPNATPSQVQATLTSANNTEAAGNGHEGWQLDSNGNWHRHNEPMMKANNF